jgi:hypothetical protein
MAVQAKFGQYLQDAKDSMSLSQTEKAVEWEQVSSKEQVLPMPVLDPMLISSFRIFGDPRTHFFLSF